jgi:hypothetical protein
MFGGMGGQGGGQQQQDRERSTWLAEDEDVWGTDPDAVPAVIGREAVTVSETEAGEFEVTGSRTSQQQRAR